jgi:hypothetical protein
LILRKDCRRFTTPSPATGTVSGGGAVLSALSSQTVTATANAGYRFVNWTQAGSVVSTSASCTFTLAGNFSLVANFARYTNTHDFNGDGYSDILWRDNSGNMAIWEMQGSTILNANSAGLGGVATTWSIVGQHDFNGDGYADMLWHDTSGTRFLVRDT